MTPEAELDAARLEIDRLTRERDVLLEALKEISKGEGRYSRDNYQFACNCIEDMKKLATDAIALCEAPQSDPSGK